MVPSQQQASKAAEDCVSRNVSVCRMEAPGPQRPVLFLELPQYLTYDANSSMFIKRRECRTKKLIISELYLWGLLIA